MYYLIVFVAIILVLRLFNLLPKLSNKFWRYVDYTIAGIAFILFLVRIPPFFFPGVVLSALLTTL
ncbi:MAG: hypothetical protein Ct9H90mP10_07120 [Actinomycetota bacterium]|nr:MAG: hypothetical protein Ct9H90mP10_07120 [Actinomycetota bacterium]